MVKVLMFDLDGTLLPMDQDRFIKNCFEGVAEKFESLGYEKDDVVKAIKYGVGAMINNDGSCTNEDAFWNKFCELLGEDVINRKEVFEGFYKNEFQQLKGICGFSELAKVAVDIAKEKGFRVVLATSPLYMKIATEYRVYWAGLNPKDFELISTYEDYKFAKPNLKYYEDIISRLNVLPEECVMVGNDVLEDMIASELGIKTFLLTECIINEKNLDISKYNQGNFSELIEFIKNL